MIKNFWELYPAVFEVSALKVVEKKRRKFGFYDVYMGRFIRISEKKLDAVLQGGEYGDFKELYNVEHIIPTTIYGDAPEIMFDLHNSVPSIKVVNDIRSTLPIRTIPEGKKITRMLRVENGIVSFTDEYFPDSVAKISIGTPMGMHNAKNKLFKGGNYDFRGCHTDCYFEPADTPFRGLIARAILYFHSKYLSSVKSLRNRVNYLTSVLPTAREWDLKYPPTEYEINRHKKIYEKTGTSNPFFLDAMKREKMPKVMRYLLDYSTEPIRMAIIEKMRVAEKEKK